MRACAKGGDFFYFKQKKNEKKELFKLVKVNCEN